MAKPEHGFSGADVRAIMAAAEGAAVISAAGVEDDAYGAGWNGDADHAPSQNAVYDILATIIADLNGFPDSLKNLAATEIAELEAIGTTTISAAQWGYLGSTSANGGALIGAANYAAMMALLSGTATGAFSLNSQNLTALGTLASAAGILTIDETASLSAYHTDTRGDARYYTKTEFDTWASNVIQQEMDYLDGVTSDIQDQLDARCLEAVFGTAIGTGLLLDTATLKASAILQKYHAIDPSANVQSLLGAADYAAMMVLLSGEAGAAFDLNSQNLTCGAITTTALLTGLQAIFTNPNIDTTTTYTGALFNFTKTAGATDEADDFYGMRTIMEMDDADSTIGHLYGAQITAQLTSGTIGDGQEDVLGFWARALIDGGTINDDVFGIRLEVDINAGTIAGDIYGGYFNVDIEPEVTSIGGNVYGVRVVVSDDQSVGGTVYMAYFKENTGVDYCIYQSGTAPSHFGGDVDINVHDAATVGLKLGGTLITASAAEVNLNDGSVAGTIVNSKSVIYGSSGEINATTLKIAGNLLNITTDGTDTTVGGALNITALAGADPATHKAVYYNTTTKSLFYDNT